MTPDDDFAEADTGLVIYWKRLGAVAAFLGVVWLISVTLGAESPSGRLLLTPFGLWMVWSCAVLVKALWDGIQHWAEVKAARAEAAEVETMGRFNLFEGGRRIALVIKLLWVVLMLLITFTSHDTDASLVLLAIGGWIVLSVMQTAIGWTVRGFLGIPWRHHHRVTPTTDVVA